ncbi:MAG: GNAT family N-acetyltransferase [Prevotellaceae bacterium]|nr:GNAT family N-acetyltransferase [Prevotellaceae bacterium]
MLRFATYHDIPALMHIRKICFSEEEAYSAFYFATRFTEYNTLVWVEEDTPAASLTLLDAEVVTAGRIFPIAYVYSVATLPEWRNKGIAAALSQYADEHLQTRGVEASLLVPASAELFDYYAKLGYKTKFFIAKHEAVWQENDAETLLQSRDLEVGDYFRLRKEAYSTGGYYVQWDKNALDFAIQECRFSEGLAWYLRTEELEGFLLAYPMKDNTVIIKESWLRGNLYPLALRLLQQAVGKDKQFIFYCQPSANSATSVPFAMIKCYTKTALPTLGNIPYFGLAKD